MQAETEKSENLFLYIDLPRFDFPVIFSEPVSISDHPRNRLLKNAQEHTSHTSTSSIVPSTIQTPSAPSGTASFTFDPHFWAVIDPDIARENPVEDKHRRLVRSHRSSPYDRELKPNAKIRDELGVRLHFAVLLLFNTLMHGHLRVI
jgi:phosphatidylinositol 3-kinase